MKRTYFHGTSFDNLKSILRDGLNPEHPEKVWTVSEYGVYMWSPDKLVEAEEADAKWKDETAKDRAYESAQMNLALAKSGKCIVLEIELDEELVSDDVSCERMTGAVVCTENISPKQIKSVWISPDLSLLKGYFIAIAMDRDLFAGEFSTMERTIGNVFKQAEIMFDSSDYPLEPLRVRRSMAA
jgi:hypothetical protein